VHLGGSFAANLMLSGDIDIAVVRTQEYSSEDVFEIFRDVYFSLKDSVRSFYLKSDWSDPRKGSEYPFGHYMGLRTVINEERWKVDIWCMNAAEYERSTTQRFDITRILLTDAQRETILTFKKYRNDHNIVCSSQSIYIAVINDQHTDPVAFFASRT